MQYDEKPIRCESKTGVEMTTLVHKGKNKIIWPRTHTSAVKNSHGETAEQLLNCLDERVKQLELFAINNSGSDVAMVKIVDNVYSNSAIRALSARQGKRLFSVMTEGPSIGVAESEDSPLGVLAIREEAIHEEHFDEALKEKIGAIDSFNEYKEEIAAAIADLDERVVALEGEVVELQEKEAEHEKLKEVQEYILRILYDQVKASIDVTVYDAVAGEWVKSIPTGHILMSGLDTHIKWDLTEVSRIHVPWEVKVSLIEPDGTERVISTDTEEKEFDTVTKNVSDFMSLKFHVRCIYGYIDFEGEDTIIITR